MISRAQVLVRRQFIALDREAVFPFFGDARNLESITPPELRFRILTPPPIAMQAGTVIDYRLRLFGVPFRWRTLIEIFEAPFRFVDVQLSGPYQSWRHLHEFEPAPGGTMMTDRVEYVVPYGPVGRLANSFFVARQLDRIFEYRRLAIERWVEALTAARAQEG